MAPAALVALVAHLRPLVAPTLRWSQAAPAALVAHLVAPSLRRSQVALVAPAALVVSSRTDLLREGLEVPEVQGALEVLEQRPVVVLFVARLAMGRACRILPTSQLS